MSDFILSSGSILRFQQASTFRLQCLPQSPCEGSSVEGYIVLSGRESWTSSLERLAYIFSLSLASKGMMLPFFVADRDRTWTWYLGINIGQSNSVYVHSSHANSLEPNLTRPVRGQLYYDPSTLAPLNRCEQLSLAAVLIFVFLYGAGKSLYQTPRSMVVPTHIIEAEGHVVSTLINKVALSFLKNKTVNIVSVLPSFMKLSCCETLSWIM